MAITDFLSGGLLDTAGQLGTAKYAYDLPQDAIDTLKRRLDSLLHRQAS